MVLQEETNGFYSVRRGPLPVLISLLLLHLVQLADLNRSDGKKKSFGEIKSRAVEFKWN